MYWLTENSFQPMMFGIMVVFVSGAFWFMLRKRVLIIVAIVALVLTIGVVVVERLIVTDSEQLVIEVHAIANAVENNDMQAVLECISSANDNLLAEVKGQMPRIDFKAVSVFSMTPPEIDFDSKPQRAKLSFTSRISADGSRSRFGMSGAGPVRVNLDYIKSPTGKWQVIGYNYDRVQPNDFLGGR